MQDVASSWKIDELTPEARAAAERAAAAAGLDVEAWIVQLIKYTAAMQRSAKPPSEDKTLAVAPSAARASGEYAVAAAGEQPPPAHIPSYMPIPPLKNAMPEARTLPMAVSYALASSSGSAQATAAGDPNAPTLATGRISAAANSGPRFAPLPAAQTAPAPRLAAGSTFKEGPTLRSMTKPATRPAQSLLASGTPMLGAKAPVASTPARDLPVTKLAARTSPAVTVSAIKSPTANAGPAPDAPAATPAGEASAGAGPRTIATDHLHPSRFAALASPKEDQIQAALNSWRSSGMLEPLLVRPRSSEPGQYEIICGIERWHAARRAFVRSIPAIVTEVDEREALKIGLVDQLRRAPLSPLNEANIYLRLLSDAGLSVEDAAKLVGKPASHVAMMVRILNLPRSVRALLDAGEITALHARALLGAPNPEALARDVVEKRLDLFQTEQLVRNAGRNADMVDAATLEDEDVEAPMIEAAAAAGAPDPLREQIAMVPPPPPLPLRPTAPPTATAPAAAAKPAVSTPAAKRPAEPSAGDVVSTDLLERKIAGAMSLKCAISERGGVGVVTLHYTNREELARIVARMKSLIDGRSSKRVTQFIIQDDGDPSNGRPSNPCVSYVAAYNGRCWAFKVCAEARLQ